MESIKNRLDFADFLNSEGCEFGAEIGVYKGEYSKILLERIPGLKLWMIDSWAQGRRVPAKDEALARVEGHNVAVIHDTSLNAAKQISDDTLDFVFIDAGHSYEDVRDDINAWVPRVKEGGFVSGHDYYDFPSGKGGVIQAVDEYVEKHGYELYVIPWDKSQSTDNRQPCWWFQK